MTDTKDDLAKTHTTAENVKHELEGKMEQNNHRLESSTLIFNFSMHYETIDRYQSQFANTHTAVESVKKELDNVIATVENMKKCER